MALKDILLHIDNSPSFSNRLDLAISLAQKHGAHLKGLYVLSHSYYAPRHGMGATEAARKAEELFCERTSQAAVSAEWLFADWSVVGVSVTEILNLYAYYADLVIVGQPDHSSQDHSTPLDLPERLGLGAGRPLLVVPYAGSFPSVGDRVMIAWRSGREAVRATNDALPILERSGHVSVITISSPGSSDRSDADNAQNICAHLGRHAVNAIHEHIHASSSMSIGDMLLNHACEQKMDMLVMGAYAQSRRGVFMHSPVAKHLLNFMTVPILMSH
jgi:nucleotide-binding universal stress UspA family protein